MAETPQIGITLDHQAAIVFANRRFLELTGWQEEKVLGRNWFDLFIPEEIREEIRRVFDTVMKARDTLAYTTYENEILTRTGERLNVAWSNVLTKDPAGAVIDVTCLGIDLTERKRAEEALLESEQKYRNLVENSSEAIFVAQDGKLVFTNQTCTLLTGYATEELLTRPFIEFIHPDDRKMVVDRHVKRSNGEEIPQRYPFRTLHKDGSIRWNELNVVLINWNGTPATLNFLSDITERKKLESQLNQSQKMEAIGTLAGGIAHNFNNILMGIQGRASLMMMDKDPSLPDHEHLNEIGQYVRRAAELTRDLLGFARGGKYEIKTTDLNSLIKQENRMFGSTTKEILIHEKYEKELWAVEVDQGQIRQAREILERGCEGFIQKPFTLTDLSRKVAELLNL